VIEGIAAKRWTVDEANAALGEVSALVNEAMVAWEVGDRAHVMAVVTQLAGRAVVLRDVEHGIIDFVGVSPSGRDYFLCWMWGRAGDRHLALARGRLRRPHPGRRRPRVGDVPWRSWRTRPRGSQRS
jgi:hypothetical protein